MPIKILGTKEFFTVKSDDGVTDTVCTIVVTIDDDNFGSAGTRLKIFSVDIRFTLGANKLFGSEPGDLFCRGNAHKQSQKQNQCAYDPLLHIHSLKQ